MKNAAGGVEEGNELADKNSRKSLTFLDKEAVQGKGSSASEEALNGNKEDRLMEDGHPVKVNDRGEEVKEDATKQERSRVKGVVKDGKNGGKGGAKFVRKERQGGKGDQTPLGVQLETKRVGDMEVDISEGEAAKKAKGNGEGIIPNVAGLTYQPCEKQ